VERLFADLHQTPVKRVEDQPFGRWIEAERKKALLMPGDIANAVGKDTLYVERLESGATHPWNLNPSDIAKLVRLFRIHMSALAQLVSSSLTVSRTHLAGDVIGRAHSGHATKERGDSVKRALDLYLARNAKKEEASEEMTAWLAAVRDRLKDLESADLLD
jgi:hypothetical protein